MKKIRKDRKEGQEEQTKGLAHVYAWLILIGPPGVISLTVMITFGVLN